MYGYSEGNPVNKVDPKGLKSCDDCAQCPCGKWVSEAPSKTYGGFLAIAGVDSSHLYLKCACSDATAKITVTCVRFGVGLGGNFSGVKYVAWGACNSKDIGFGGYEASGDIYAFYHVGVSATGSGGIPSGSGSVEVGVGLSLAVSLYAKCWRI